MVARIKIQYPVEKQGEANKIFTGIINRRVNDEYNDEILIPDKNQEQD